MGDDPEEGRRAKTLPLSRLGRCEECDSRVETGERGGQ